MDHDDPVFNEPVASGALRVHLVGDRDTALGHLRGARQLLGQMRSIYGVNQRIADGQPGGFYRMRHQLPDGTLIEAWTNDGQDAVRISAPVPASTPPVLVSTPAPAAAGQARPRASAAPAVTLPVPAPPAQDDAAPTLLDSPAAAETVKTRVGTRSVVVCGTNSTFADAFMWRESDGATFGIPLPAGGPNPYMIAAAVSGGGDVVGYVSFGKDGPELGVFQVVAFVWTEQRGSEVLDGGNAMASAISNDGSTIGGSTFVRYYDNSPEFLYERYELPCYWLRGTDGSYGRIALPLPGGCISGRATGVSDDGKTLVGYCSSYEDPDGFTIFHDSIVRWTRDGGMEVIRSVTYSGNFPEIPVISGDGTAVAWLSPYSERQMGMYWSEKTGVVTLGEQFVPGALSYDGDVVYGNFITPDVITPGARWTVGGGLELITGNLGIGTARAYRAEDADVLTASLDADVTDGEQIEAFTVFDDQGEVYGKGRAVLVTRNGGTPVLHLFDAVYLGSLGMAGLNSSTDTGDDNEPV